MYLTGIIGYPLNYTLSPIMHNKAFHQLQINGIYLPLSVAPAQFPGAINGIRALGFRGLNVTIPYKEKIISLIDSLNPEARRIGAVNTIVCHQNRMTGYNTDAYGFRRSLSIQGIKIKEKNVLLIGSGGAGRACAHVIQSLKPNRFLITNRTAGKLKKMIKLFNAEKVLFDKLEKVVPEIDVVVNATSNDFQKRLIKKLRKGTIYYDINYQYPIMPHKDIKIINGLRMLVLQGARAFRIWTGQSMPIDIMKKTVGVEK
jgi:shikimate dehydrogenase